MNKRIYSFAAALAITVTSTFSAFAAYVPFTQPKENGYFEFSEDFSECTDSATGGNSLAVYPNGPLRGDTTDGKGWLNVGGLNVDTAIITRDDGVKWTLSSKKFNNGQWSSGVSVDTTNQRLYVTGGNSNQCLIRLDMSDALANDLKAKNLPQESQEIEFEVANGSRLMAVALFVNGTDNTYVLMGTKNSEDTTGYTGDGTKKGGAFVQFIQSGSPTATYFKEGAGSGLKHFKVKVEHGLLTWDMGNGEWTGSAPIDDIYFEEMKYLAGAVGAGDGFGYINSFSYKTGNTYTEDVHEPAEAIYVNNFDKANVVDADEGIYELTEATVVRKVEYKNYGGGSFALSTDGTDWDTFDRTYVRDLTDEDPDNDEYKGKWTAVGSAAADTSRWVNTCNTKLYKYVKVPANESADRRGNKTGVFKVLKDVTRNSTVTLRKGGSLDLFLSKDSGWANAGFSAASSDANFVETLDTNAYTKDGYVRLKAKKETYQKDQANTPIVITLTGLNSTYTVNAVVKGPLSDALGSGSVTDMAAYIASQQAVLDELNTRIANATNGTGLVSDVQDFFVDTASGHLSVNDLDMCDANDFTNVDSHYAERIMTYGSFTAASIDDLDDIGTIFEKEIYVGKMNSVGATPVQKTDEDGNPVYEEDGVTPVYYTDDELVIEMLETYADKLELPINNKYYRKDTDDNDDGRLDDTAFSAAIRAQLVNRTFASEAELMNAIDSATVMAVYNNNSNADYMMEMLDTYKSTLGIAEGSDDDKKLDEIKADASKSAQFVQSMKSATISTPADIAAYITAYTLVTPTPTPVPSVSGGGGTGGGTVSKTPSGMFSQADKTVAPKVQIFNDVPLEFWGYEAIRYMNAKGAAKGYESGEFLPNNQITKAEFVQMIMKLFNPVVEITEDYVNPFDDVKDGDWFANSIVKANIYGIYSGNGESAEPNKPITRQEMAALIYRMIEKLGKTLSSSGDVSRFADEDEIAEWAYSAVMEMQAAGIVSGDNGRFMPNDNATRAQAAQMLYRTMMGFDAPVSMIGGTE